jgi:aldose 1-epimerase
MDRSGDQITITSGEGRAVVTTVGATLRAYTVGSRAVLDGFDADEVCPDGRGQVLAPWPNRIAHGRYAFAGQEHQLPIDEPAHGHAIHGLARWAEWHLERRTEGAAILHHRLCARPGYPSTVDLSIEYALSPSALSVTLTARNVGSAPCPFGAGAHPYLSFSSARADDIHLCVRAREWLEVDARCIPVRSRPVEGSALDFRCPRVVGATALDHAFFGLERDEGCVACVLLRHGGEEIRLLLERPFDFAQIYTGDTLADATRRRRSVAVEPMTCAPDAFNSTRGLRVLVPGESFVGRWSIVVA